jgi:hypothetical protein
MNKKIFNAIERFAIWKCHEERCWLCTEPLNFRETTVDHFFPEKLLLDDYERAKILMPYGLTDDTFDIDSFENWLPCHPKCNQLKSTKIPSFNPGHDLILRKLISSAPRAQGVVKRFAGDKKKDTIFLDLLNALEKGKISFDDLIDFVGHREKIQIVPSAIIMLNGGYWVYRDDVARQGYCTCENSHCLDSDEKVYCYFRSNLSSWVIKTGLYHKCYDEIITCNRCNYNHKRGHIGKVGICGLPFNNQELQTDN